MIDPGKAETFPWPPPWASIKGGPGWYGGPTAEVIGSAARADWLEAEIRREVCPGHALFGHDCRVVAVNTEDPNEFVFLTTSPMMPLALVHLTWQVESSPEWPYAVGYPTLEAFAEAVEPS